MPTISKEDYLKVIYQSVQNSGKSVTVSELSQILDVSNAAISDMAKKLNNMNLISYEKYHGMELTKKGEEIALNVLRRHRLWELFLMNVLKISWADVHDQAEKLEHNTSDFLIDKIDEFLGFPEFDPHGAPIPNKYGILPVIPEMILLKAGSIGTVYIVKKVNDYDSELINYLSQIGLLLNSTIELKHIHSFDKSIKILLNGYEHILSEKLTENIFISEKKQKRHK